MQQLHKDNYFSDHLGQSLLSVLNHLSFEFDHLAANFSEESTGLDNSARNQEQIENQEEHQPCNEDLEADIESSDDGPSNDREVFEEDEVFETPSDGILDGVSFEATEEVDIDVEAFRKLCSTSNSEESYFSAESEDNSPSDADSLRQSKKFPVSAKSPDSQRNLSDPSFSQLVDDDEWENDDDVGYIIVPITSEEFCDMEEESSGRLAYEEDMKQEVDSWAAVSTRATVGMSPKSKTDIFESKDLATVEAELASVEKIMEASSPSSPIEIIGDNAQSFETEQLLVTTETDKCVAAANHSPKVISGSSQGAPPTIEVASPDLPAVDSAASAGTSIHESEGEKRRTEIMGQHRFIGADKLQHNYFNLKVIFEPFKTGFEESKNFNPPKGTIIAGRYEVSDFLGQAAFSSALQCVDLIAEEGEAQWVCLKVIKNSKDFFDQSLDEIKLLQYINAKGDPNKHHVLQLIDYFYCKEHLFIVSELLRENLYEFGRYVRESGLEPYYTIPRLKKIMKQVLEALQFIHSLDLIHCDIKPENIVIKSYSRCEVKLIDFGSSCFTSDHLSTYIQSRSYRAPEVIIGHQYDTGIDIWSIGAVLAELHTGYVLFQNDSVATMLARISGIVGPFPPHVLAAGRESSKYFTTAGIVYETVENSGYALIYPKKTTLASRLHLQTAAMDDDDRLLLDFVRTMLNLDPAARPRAPELLKHPWLAGADDLAIPAPNLNAQPPPAPADYDQDADFDDATCDSAEFTNSEDEDEVERIDDDL